MNPGADFRVLIDRITGEQLAAMSPRIAAQIHPLGFVDGSFEVNGDTRLSFARRGPLEFNLERSFGAKLHGSCFKLKATPDAAPTDFDRLYVNVKRVDPATGNVRLSSMDLSGIRGRVKEGVRIAGFLLPRPAPEGDLEADSGL